MAQPNGWAQGRILVRPSAGLSEEALAEILANRGGRSISHNQRIGLHIVAVPPEAEWAIAKALSKSPLIDFAEPDMLVEPSEILPDDPKFPNEWHLPKIQAPTAWETSTGGGITVAILDTGVDPDHPELVNRLVPGWNSASLSDDSTPVHGHGTWVAGVVAAETNNGVGVASIAYGAHLMPIRVTNSSDGYAYYSDIARAVTWAADQGAQVANISYDVTSSAAISSAAQYMRSKGGVVVVAAGNSGGNPGYGDNPYMISVSATTSGDAKASWSSYGDYVDVSAPGAKILSTSDGGGYSTVSGTSFASPTTAGVVALIMGANGALAPSDVESILESTADDLGSTGWDPSFGFGRVNAAAAVQAAVATDPGDLQSPAAAITSPAGGATVAGWVAVAVSATDNVGVGRVELYADGSLVGTDLTAPYQFSWDSTQAGDGAATLTARAFDDAGNRGDAPPVTLTVDNAPDVADTTPPAVSIASPSDGATVSGNVTLSAHATDDVGVALLTIYVDGQTTCAGNGASVSCGWNTRKLSGSHTISARAEDGAGNAATTSISVTVASSTKGGGGSKGGGGKGGGGKGGGKKK
ncbi:MAG: S8 family serine peptidase [Nitrospirota bacterium]|jgi:hypothetical protein